MANLSTSSQQSKLAHTLPTASTNALVKIGHVQLRDLVHSTGPRGRVAYVSDKCIKEVDVRRGTQTTRTLAALDFQPNCIALAPSGSLLIAGGQRAELQITTVAPPPRPVRRSTRARGYGTAVSDERGKPVKGSYSPVDESDEETDEEGSDDGMEWSRPGESEATRTRKVEVRGAGVREIASINNHVLVLGDEMREGGVFGETRRNPEQTRIVVSNNDEYVRVFDVDTRESAGKEWGSMELVGATKLGTAANHVSFSPDGRTMLAVGDDTRLQIFNVNGRSQMVDFEHVGSYTSGTEPNFTSAWSASGLQFAAASQDGTVTAWDVRSSRPLASWHVPYRSGYRPHTTRPSSPPPPALVPARASVRVGSGAWRSYAHSYDPRYAGAYINTEQFMWDPSTQGPGHGIRSLRFTPRGASSPEMLVFAEHTSHVHIIDAQTFTSHQILDIPRVARTGPASPLREPLGLPAGAVDCGSGGVGTGMYFMPGQGVDPRGEREVDLTGVTFDRSGGWMYVGTERSVVEYEMVGRGRRSWDAAEWN
ncbi:hypothetical protein FRC07_005796 [Ceratobasidium sp. 392]|nr:hypothetical protein FRC07_005796 [Ceratobasidium sp. 392]